MKSKILVVAFVVGGLQVLPGVRVAQAGAFDSVLDGARSFQAARQDRTDGKDRRDRDGQRSRRNSNDPDVIVTRAYEDILNREPDKEGLRLYRSKIIDEGWSERDVRQDLMKSAEHKGRTPASADVIIRRAYQDILGRDPDQAGLANYRTKMVNEGWSERDVRSDLQKSPERRMTGGISKEQADQMVRRAYQSVLGRDPDTSGSNLYIQKIMQNRWSENDVANELRKSPEYRQKHNR